ncbi:RTA1 like protein-domain-containing protein, partial [Pseudomassariella vexata]
IGFGPNSNCTVDICPLEMSVTGYYPSLPVNIIFIALYAIAMVIHLIIGFRWKTWWFMSCCTLSTISAIVGYVGRILMHYDPFGFFPFLIQAVFLTIVPVFYCAAIYVTLALAINNLNTTLSRVRPSLFYWIFLPSDLIALLAQISGAAISATSSSGSLGSTLSTIGLSLQLGTVLLFSICFIDFDIRYFRSPRGCTETSAHDTRLRFFFGAIIIALLLTVARSGYRLAELNQGYSGELMKEEALFIMLEGCAVVLSVFFLGIGHPGFVLR